MNEQKKGGYSGSYLAGLGSDVFELGYIRLARIEEESLDRHWDIRMVGEVLLSLGVETFKHDGETCVRLSDRVVPVLPNRDFSWMPSGATVRTLPRVAALAPDNPDTYGQNGHK